MIEFLLTPIGIWTALLTLAGAGFLVGVILSLANSVWGEGLAFYSASAVGVIGLLGVLPALYLSGMTELLTVVGAIYAIVLALFLVFAFAMSASGSSRGY